jgi:cytidylate kinase
MVAGRLGYLYVDTGAMYRAVALRLLRQGAPLLPASLIPILASLDIRLELRPGDGAAAALLDGQPVDAAIRTAGVTSFVSPVAANSLVRRAMALLQRRIAALGSVTMEGRDIGSVVLPSATTKVYLTAALRHRAWRRYREVVSQPGAPPTSPMAQYWAMRRRDRYDRARADSPLRVAAGATVIDSGNMSPDDVADAIIALHRANTESRRTR